MVIIIIDIITLTIRYTAITIITLKIETNIDYY